MAQKIFGGEARIVLSNGVALTTRALVKYDPGGIEATEIINQDGSVAKQVTLKGYRADWEFQDLDVNEWSGLLREGSINITHVEELTKERAIWTDAAFFGAAEVDRATGAVTGLYSVARYFDKKVSG